MGHRNPLAAAGEARRPLKDAEGKVREFDTLGEAVAEAERLRKELTTLNVTYTVEEQ